LHELPNDDERQKKKMSEKEKSAEENGTPTVVLHRNGSKTSVKSGSENGDDPKETTPLNPQPT